MDTKKSLPCPLSYASDRITARVPRFRESEVETADLIRQTLHLWLINPRIFAVWPRHPLGLRLSSSDGV
jgi:hypothetical protein